MPFMRAPPSGPKHLPKAPLPNTFTLGIRISTHEFGWGHKHSDHSGACLQAKSDLLFLFFFGTAHELRMVLIFLMVKINNMT